MQRTPPVPSLTIEQMLVVIVGECRNGCSDEHSTYEFFINRPNVLPVDLKLFLAFINSLNFSAIRENDSVLSEKLTSTRVAVSA